MHTNARTIFWMKKKQCGFIGVNLWPQRACSGCRHIQEQEHNIISHLGSEMFSLSILSDMKGTMTRLADNRTSLIRAYQNSDKSQTHLIHNDIPYFLNEHPTLQWGINCKNCEWDAKNSKTKFKLKSVYVYWLKCTISLRPEWPSESFVTIFTNMQLFPLRRRREIHITITKCGETWISWSTTHQHI